jgi:hypothetical protein
MINFHLQSRHRQLLVTSDRYYGCMHRLTLYLVVISCVYLSGCYTFSGISIAPELKTFHVDNFTLASSALSAPADLGQRFSESLRFKVRNESRLVQKEVDADIEFSGAITGFNLRGEAPQAGNTVALNKIEIVIDLTYTNNKEENKNWRQQFSFFRTFPSDQDFLSLQDGLLTDIFRQINEDIFNKAFTDW